VAIILRKLFPENGIVPEPGNWVLEATFPSEPIVVPTLLFEEATLIVPAAMLYPGTATTPPKVFK
jgi:hypothetical protein